MLILLISKENNYIVYTALLYNNPLLILVQGPKINENENEIYENKEIISYLVDKKMMVY